METSAEISGPVLAGFQHSFGESRGDLLAILLGAVNVINYNENSDLATQTERKKVRLVVQGWIIVSIGELIDIKTGKLKKENIQGLIMKNQVDKEFVGILKFRKNATVDLSFVDRTIMRAVQESEPHLYIVVGEEVTPTTLSIKYSISTYIIEKNKNCSDGPWCEKLPLLVPNLGTDQRVGYVHGGGSMALRQLVNGTGFEKNCFVNVEESFNPLLARFRNAMGVNSARVVELGVMKTALKDEVIKLHQELDARLSLSKQMEMMKGLQDNLESAFRVIIDGFGEEKQSISDGPDMFGEVSDILVEMDSSESSTAK